MKGISKRARAEAIRALTVCADDRLLGRLTCTWHVVSDSSDAGAIAHAAYEAASRPLLRAWANSWAPNLDRHAVYLEAAALLRDGWSPGDPVERLR